MNQKPKVLLIAPLIDIPTITSNEAVYHILSYIDNTKFEDNIDIDLLWGIRANWFEYWYRTGLKKYNAIIYYGHGKPNKLYGNHVFFSMINKENILRAGGVGFDTMACYSAKALGIFAVENGIKAYIGTKDVYYAAFPEKERDYLKDWIDYTTSKTKALLDGKTFGEAYKIFTQRATYYLNIYSQNLGYRNYDWYFKTVKHNLENTVLYGDINARIY